MNELKNARSQSKPKIRFAKLDESQKISINYSGIRHERVKFVGNLSIKPGQKHLVKSNEDRQLHQKRQAGRKRVYLILFVKVEGGLSLRLFVIFVFFFYLVKFRLQLLQFPLGTQGFLKRREKNETNQDGQRNDGKTHILSWNNIVKPDQDIKEWFCEQDVKKFRHAGSYPPLDRGLHRKIRPPPLIIPRSNPYCRRDILKYSEQDG